MDIYFELGRPSIPASIQCDELLLFKITFAIIEILNMPIEFLP